ncbi:hypothetical protein [Nesterenkonia halobia]|uniref:PKD domain-containing protein n=1 Tax=Nesterenkonia halobia TaxID=37922 RepID=A0ABP6R6U9_9MICC
MIYSMRIRNIWSASLAIGCLMIVGLESPGRADTTEPAEVPESTAGIGDNEWELELEDQYTDETSYEELNDDSPPASETPNTTPSADNDIDHAETLYDLQNTCIDEETLEYNMMCSSIYFLNKPCENQGDYEDVEGYTVQCAPGWELEDDPGDEENVDEPSPATVAESAFMSMSPDAPRVRFEPHLLGFGYKGRHTNMYAEVDEQSISEEFLGQTVEIRASPVIYHWDYGDGMSRTTTDPGGPLPEHDGTGEKINKTDFATKTSLVYEETGIYPVTVTTVYVGEFRYAGRDWTSLPGQLRVESSPGEADIWTQNSRWVSGACESQDQWGCNGPVQFDPSTDRPPKIYQDQYDENGRWIGPVN